MAKITKTCEKTVTKKITKTCEKIGRKKIIKSCERTGRKKIAKLLLLMGFHDDDHDTTVKIMRQRLRQIEERTKAATAHENRSTIKKITIKFGGKKVHVNPATKAPLETSVASGDDDMEIDSSNILFEDRSCKKINYVDEVDQSFEEKRLENMETTHATSLPSQNPNSGMDVKEFIRSIGGSEAVLVIEKTLTKSDCDKNQGRLLIPMLQVKNRGFLGTDEEKKLGMRESISVEVFDPERRKLTLNLAQWKMKNENYVLKTNWKKLVVINGLKENVVIRVLAFRVDQKLCFAVVRV